MFSNLKKLYQEKVSKSKFESKWHNRNVTNVIPFLKGLRIDYTTFHSDVFCIFTEELADTLQTKDLGFVSLKFEDPTDVFRDFSLHTMYNTEFNICIRLVDEKTMLAIKTAVAILVEANGSLIRESQEHVFIATLKVLLNKNSQKREVVNKKRNW